MRGIVLCLIGCLCMPGSHFRAQSSNGALIEQLFQEGEKALVQGRYDEAARAYEQLRQMDPKTAEIHGRLGLIYFQQRKFAEAVPALRQALKLKPSLPNTDSLLAMSLAELGRLTEALPGLQNGFRRSSDSALKRQLGLQLQRAYTGLQRDREAVEVALELTRLYPEDPEVLYHSGRIYGNYAYLAMRRLSQIAPDSVWLRQAAGDNYESQGRYELAIREYRAVLALDARRPGIHFRLGRVFLARSTHPDSQAEAMKEFEQELQIDPTNANAAYELAEIHRKSGNLDHARRLFETALSYYPEFEEALIGLGRVLIAQGKPERALPLLGQATSLNPSNEVTHYQLAQAHKALGHAAQQQKALAEFRRLRSQKAGSTKPERNVFLLSEATKQQLDQEATP
ncbi:MAG: tetratricopeptide repeat protein [Acidobacteriota bacterium]